jgi:hypothetical protein
MFVFLIKLTVNITIFSRDRLRSYLLLDQRKNEIKEALNPCAFKGLINHF